MESPKQNGTQKYLRDNLLQSALFLQVGLSGVLLSKHLNKSHDFDVITLELYCSGRVATFLAFRFLLSALRYSYSYCLNHICF